MTTLQAEMDRMRALVKTLRATTGRTRVLLAVLSLQVPDEELGAPLTETWCEEVAI